MANTADSIVLTVRDLIPDPSSTPSADGGLFTAASLYRWINEAVKLVSKGIGWQIIDWYPIQVLANQSFYPVDAKWHRITDAFKDRFMLVLVDESAITWPMVSSATRSMWYAIHSANGNFSVSPFPTPSASDPNNHLFGNQGVTDTVLVLGDTTGFMATGGFVKIDSEIIYYNSLTPTTLNGCIRGQAGTTAATHLANALVYHCSLWVKGPRSPIEITGATSVIELPTIFQTILQLYVLAQCRRSEQDHQEARALMGEFNNAMKDILADPSWRIGSGTQIQEYLGNWQSQLVFGRIILG